jgi:hypothetical protein
MASREEIRGMKRGFRTRLIPICGAAILALAGLDNSAPAGEHSMRATVDKPATIPVARRTSSAPAKAGDEQLVVTINGYQSSPAGPVVFVVTALCGGTKRELGRFGILESGPVAADAKAEPQSFAFSMPNDPPCHDPIRVTVSVEPTQGNGKGASVSIQNARIEPNKETL